MEQINKQLEEDGNHLRVKPGDYVHRVCRLRLYNKRDRSDLEEDPEDVEPTRKLRSVLTFDFKLDCLYCGEPISTKQKKHDRWHRVMTKEFTPKLEKRFQERGDQWSYEVKIIQLRSLLFS